MKKTLLTIALFLAAEIMAWAQVPQQFNYQGIARSTTGTPLAGVTIGIQIIIHDGSPGGTIVYQETQSASTNTFGLYNIAVGTGTVVSGTFSGIAWGSGTKYMEVDMDPTGGTSYSLAGTSQLLSVPYAMYSANSSLPNIGTAGTYGSATQVPVFTTDAEGRVTSVTNTTISAATGTVTSVAAGTGLSGGTITGSGTISMPSVGTAGTYGSATQVPVFTTDVEGRVTGVTNTTISAGTGTVTSVAAGTGLSGGTITSTGTISMPAVGTPGTYGSATHVPVFTTDAEGRVTSVTNTTISAGTGTVTSVAAGTGLSGGTITGSGTISMPAVGTPGTYGSATQVPVFTTDAEGRVTSATNTLITVPTVSGTTNYVSKFTSATALGNAELFDNGTSVGLGTSTPTSMSKIEVSGIGAFGSLPYYQAGIVADGSSTDASGSGVYGESGWRGVFGRNPGTASGVEAIGTLGRVEGNSYTIGYGVKGECVGTGPANYALYGIASGTTGTSLGAYASGVSGGVYGTSTGSGALYTSFLIDIVPGVVGQVRSVSSNRPIGVAALAANTTVGQTGLVALADSSPVNNYGVEAYAANGAGTAANYAVYADVDGTGSINYAGYFVGEVYASSASSSIKAFKIDDPRDPANKYLYHSSVESNDMMDLYNGNVITDADGDATVSLPSYFTVLNKDYKYQLTVIGQFAQAIIAEKVTGNQFKIKTDKPNVEVSWMVAGVRQDPAANTYRIKDEVEKPSVEKGTYLMPELYGYGRDKATGYRGSSMDRSSMKGGVSLPINLTPAANKGDNSNK